MVALTRAGAKGHKETANTSPAALKKKRRRAAADTSGEKGSAKKRKQAVASVAGGAGNQEDMTASAVPDSTWDSITSLGLFARLPGELRNHIYALALEDPLEMPCKLFVSLGFNNQRKIEDKKWSIRAASPRLLLISHQILTEARWFLGEAYQRYLEPYVAALEQYVEHCAKEGDSVSRTRLTINLRVGHPYEVDDRCVLCAHTPMPPFGFVPKPLADLCKILRAVVRDQRGRIDKEWISRVMFHGSRDDNTLTLEIFSESGTETDATLERMMPEGLWRYSLVPVLRRI